LLIEKASIFKSMNFLAHLYLSGDHEKRMVGNFIGDFVKGKPSEHWHPEILRGLKIHREIDEFTDNHPIVHQSKERLRSKYRHYAGVIVDIYYDHFLASLWVNYHSVSLDLFAQKAYYIMRQHWAILPDKAQFMLPHMEKNNWLVNYAKLEGIQRALNGMSNRTRFDSKMDESVVDLKKSYSEFRKEFEGFFPDLVNFVAQEIPEIKKP
jgi:acyl carrier protein phosphodiesterase